MENIFGSTHFNTIATWLKDRFGCRIMKLSLDGGFTCPNRDGSKGTGGCLFCSEDGSGHYASTIPEQIQLLSGKWPEGK
ncbi:MAG: TIGR01212 family radical SAM protein, partial [Firmicutes bacterium]|nr:TIGR01212 family radical SAM protein [Bacillota bacterium]